MTGGAKTLESRGSVSRMKAASTRGHNRAYCLCRALQARPQARLGLFLISSSANAAIAGLLRTAVLNT